MPVAFSPPMQKLQNHIANRAWTGVAIASLLCAVSETSVHANGIYGNGTGAASMAMGGTDVAWAKSPLEAMGDNPAGLGFLDTSEFDIGGIGASAYGHFSKPSGNSSGDLDEMPEALPEGAFGTPIGKLPVSVGVSFIPEAMLLANWSYLDPANGGGITYGNQTDKSEILVLRSAVGVGVRICPQLSLGASFGVVYNQNELDTPYVFQNIPAGGPPLNGAKALLSLRTAGWGWNGQVGLIYRPITNLQFGLAYQTRYTVHSTGAANGNAWAQFSSTPGNPTYGYTYNAEVDNKFPDQVSVGTSWKFLPKWRVAGEIDWIDWSQAFNTLPVKLSGGTGVVAGAYPASGATFTDYVPLNWRNEFVYRAGLEYAITENLFLRGGYSYGQSPVPDATLSPMTAAIMENTITAGIGYHWRACEFDFAYQYDLPVTHHVQTSSLLDGEYSNSSTQVAINWFALTMRVKF
jgi:long-chain fatty acid transport protein